MKKLSIISKINLTFTGRYNTRKRLQWKCRRTPIDMDLNSDCNIDSLRTISSSFRINYLRKNCLYKHYNQFVRASRKTHEKLPGLRPCPKRCSLR